MKKALSILLLMGVCLVTGGWAMAQYGNDLVPTTKHQTVSVKNLSPDDLEKLTVKSESITTNLKDGHYAKITFQYVGDTEKAKSEIEKRQFQIQSFIVKELSETDSTALLATEGTDALSKKVKDYVNSILTDGHLLEIYTTEKVVQ